MESTDKPKRSLAELLSELEWLGYIDVARGDVEYDQILEALRVAVSVGAGDGPA